MYIHLQELFLFGILFGLCLIPILIYTIGFKE